jgi:excisionase family DNA binding protein
VIRGAPDDLEALVYSVPEAAQVLGVSPTTVRRLIGRGVLPALFLGRRILIGRAALARWVDGAEMQGVT